MEENYTKGENFYLDKSTCGVCNNSLESYNMNAKVVKYKCEHIEHLNCCSKHKLCLKCLKNSYIKYAPKKENKESQNADEIEYSEFLGKYKLINQELKKEEKR